MKCPNCYTELPDTATFCYMCKRPIPAGNTEVEKQPCPNCGAPLPKTAKECYVCHKKFDNGINTTTIPASTTVPQNGSGFVPGYKPYTRLSQNPQNNQQKGMQSKKNEAGCGTLILIILVILAIGYYLNNSKKEEDEESDTGTQTVETTQTIKETTKSTTENNISPLDKKLASDMKNMRVGDIGKKGKTYLSLAYVKRSNEIHYLSVTDYADSEHEILYFFVDTYNDSDELKNITSWDFSCYIDGSQVDHFDCNFLFTEDGVSQYNSNEVDAGCGHLLALDYEVPLEWSEAKLYYKSDCIWIIKNDEVSSEAYDGRKIIDAGYSYQNTPVNKTIYSGDYELVYDGFEYYTAENYYTDVYYAVFKFTMNAKSEIDTSLFGHNMRCYQNNYLSDDATYTMDNKIDDYINIFDVDEVHEGMSAKIYIAFEIPEKGGDFRMVFDDGYIIDNKIADVFVLGTDSDDGTDD